MVELINDDCRNFMKTMIVENIQVDLTITSPPYDDLRTYNNSLEWNYDIFKEIADLLYKVTKPGGIIVWIVGDKTHDGTESGSSFKQALYFKEIGFKLHDTMIYLKDNPPPVGGKLRYYQHFEYMFILSKGKPKTFNPIISKRRNKHNDKRTHRFKGFTRESDGSFQKKQVKINEEVKIGNVWRYVVGGGNVTSDKEAHKHPAIFPEKLVQDHIVSWSNKNDLIFDPFMGSGTTGKIAILNDRNFIGIEKVKEYYELSCNRMKNIEQQLCLF